MDDTTRLITAYALLLLGIPFLAAKILWAFPGAVSGFILDRISGSLRRFADAVAEGFLSLLLACLIFTHLDIPVAIAVPTLLISLHLIWNWATNKAAVNALPSVTGIVMGFFLYPKVLTFLPSNLAPLA